MKACAVVSSSESQSRAFAGWQRALAADTVSFDQLCGLALDAERLPYDLVLLPLSPESVSWVEPLQRLLTPGRGVVLAVSVEDSLPDAPSELVRFRRALGAADFVVASDYSLVLDLRALGIPAVDVAPPWFETAPSAFQRGNERTASRFAGRRRALSVVTAGEHSQSWLLGELGAVAYAWVRLRYRIVFHAPTASPARVATSDLVYLTEPLLDGGELAARCAEDGVLLVAPRGYHAARFCFPFTSYAPEPGRAGALLLWLLSQPELAACFREHAAHRARQLSDGDRRQELGQALMQRFPRFECPPDASRPCLLDQIRHVSGPRDFSYEEDECALVCLVRNGGEHIPSFLEHYRKLGVRRFVFVDNGSDDGSRALLERQPDATVYESSLPHKHYENELRRLIIERHCRGRWCLNVDIDELFDYPGSERLSLGDLLGYLRRQGATAMVGYLLDMFAHENVFGDARPVDLKSEYPHYDLMDVEKVAYFAPEVANFCDANQLVDPGVGCYFGGIRKRIFGGKERAQFLLTKHPLIFLDGVLRPSVHPHYSNRARLADVTGVLYHYKLTPSFKAKVSESVRSDRYVEFAQRQYDEYHRQVGARASLVIDTPGRQRLESAWQLLEQGFLRASRAFRDYAERRGEPLQPRVSARSAERGAQHV